ncbi:MAG TPA: DNA translocase FtsK 4TM domain-containing protein [Micropepsaceae bacterium]|nr:DNA translocase FtsK 4TM domain-containing protein [Micropepsaceae bacterium]
MTALRVEPSVFDDADEADDAVRPRAPRRVRAPAEIPAPPRILSFLPDALWRPLVIFARQSFGLLLWVMALAALVALVTADPADPSMNAASGHATRNFLGSAGAFFADFTLQTLGIGVIALILPLAAWGVYLMLGHRVTRWGLRLVALPLAAILLAGAFAILPPMGILPTKAGLGGVIGTTLVNLCDSALALGGLQDFLIVAALLAGVGGLVFLLFSAQLTFGAVGRFLSLSASLMARAWRYGVEAWHWLHSKFSRSAPLVERAMPAFDDDAKVEPKALAAPTAEPVRKEPRIARDAKPQRQSKRAKAEAEPQLAFDDAKFELPPLSLLAKPKVVAEPRESDEALEQNARVLEGVLSDFGVRGTITKVRPGPVVTMYELEPAAGIKASRVIGLADDVARSMSATSARIAVVPGRNVIGIELPNRRRETVYLRELLSGPEFETPRTQLTLALGKDISGASVTADLARMPHLLIAGTTGSGKSVAINTMILSLLYRFSPRDCRMIMIDPKMLELSVYDGIPHLLAPVVTEAKKAIVALKWAVREMEDRYRKMSKLGVRNIEGFNERVARATARREVLKRVVQTGFDRETGEPIYEEEVLNLEPLPFLVIVIDEMADLMIVAGKEIEALVQRLAQMARAAGIHVVMATQRPSVDVITGTIKANFPTRISFQVTSKIDSRTILGEQGAEQLLGQGDMLYMAGGGRIRRVHGPFVSDSEVEEVVSHLKEQGHPEYLDAVTQDPDEEDEMAMALGEGEGGSGDQLYDQAVNIVLRERKATTSYIQRRLQIGYNRAARIIEKMEEEGILSPPNHQGKRDVLVGDGVG